MNLCFVPLFSLLWICTMGRVLILHFNHRDDTLKIKTDDSLQLKTVLQIIEFLSSKLEPLGIKTFAIDLIINGKFTAVQNNTAINWETNFLSVFVIDLSKPPQTTPFLCISGRAFDTLSDGIRIVAGEKCYTIIMMVDLSYLRRFHD